ncbi:hypothetical protein SESBI_12493 [Sesbania bispinosa]|nr:hypothetical protein SESBI_12493 [Sesbania bispinosa]
MRSTTHLPEEELPVVLDLQRRPCPLFWKNGTPFTVSQALVKHSSFVASRKLDFVSNNSFSPLSVAVI